jgi:hypothetical protein
MNRSIVIVHGNVRMTEAIDGSVLPLLLSRLLLRVELLRGEVLLQSCAVRQSRRSSTCHRQ